MLNDQRNGSFSYAGIPYEDINWYDIAGQPFGIASYFNAIVFGDANNIVDTKIFLKIVILSSKKLYC